MQNLFCVTSLLNDCFIRTIIYLEIERAIYVIGSTLQLYNQTKGSTRKWRDCTDLTPALQQCEDEAQVLSCKYQAISTMFNCIIVFILSKPQVCTKCSQTLFICWAMITNQRWYIRHYKYTFVLVLCVRVTEPQAVLGIFLLPQPLLCWDCWSRLPHSSWYK